MTTDPKPGTAELLYRQALQMGLSPVWLIRGHLLAIQLDDEHYLYDAKSALNSQLSSALTADKLATRRILERHSLPGIPYIRPAHQGEAEAFLAAHSKIIIKPLKGSNCQDVHIVDDPEQLRLYRIEKYILEQYIQGRELRYLLLDGQVIGVHESEYAGSVSESRNLQRISYPKPSWHPKLIAISLEVVRILKLRYAAVDFLVDPQGKAYILEVNSSPGMKWFHAPTTGPMVNVAQLFLEAMMREHEYSTAPLGFDSLQAYS